MQQEQKLQNKIPLSSHSKPREKGNGKWILWSALSIFALIQPGYIQPDEYFQNPEITAGEIFNVTHFRAWEFDSSNSLRTISLPYLTTGIPLLLTRYFADLLQIRLSVQALLVIPRIVFLLLIPVLEYLLQGINNALHGGRSAGLTSTFRSSYLTVIFLSRTFSNSLEVTFFALLLYFVVRKKLENHTGRLSAVTIGIVSALGVFNRPTFLAFGLVPWMFFLWKNKIRNILWCFGSGALSCILLIAVDSWYYDRFVITPLQFVLYNINPKNNAAHGLHPRYFHLTVSLPQLFGPLCLLLLNPTTWRQLTRQKLLTASFIVPFLLISCIPHQEPRFLLPLLVPVFLLLGEQTWRTKRLRVIWLIFNLLIGVVFGVFHQGGVTKSLSSVRDLLEAYTTSQVFFYKTYIPPTYLLLLPWEHHNRVIDLGLSKVQLDDVRNAILSSNFTYRYLVTPATVNVTEMFSGRPLWQPLLIERFCPHWSFEAQPNYPALWANPWQMCLNLYAADRRIPGQNI